MNVESISNFKKRNKPVYYKGIPFYFETNILINSEAFLIIKNALGKVGKTFLSKFVSQNYSIVICNEVYEDGEECNALIDEDYKCIFISTINFVEVERNFFHEFGHFIDDIYYHHDLQNNKEFQDTKRAEMNKFFKHVNKCLNKVPCNYKGLRNYVAKNLRLDFASTPEYIAESYSYYMTGNENFMRDLPLTTELIKRFMT